MYFEQPFEYCRFRIFSEGFILQNLANAKFVKIKSSQNGKIILSLSDIGKSCHGRNFFTSQICLLTLFAKIDFSLKIPHLQIYSIECPAEKYEAVRAARSLGDSF